jgi:hypothetical protein
MQEIPNTPSATERIAILELFGPKFRIEIRINVASSIFVGSSKFLGTSPIDARKDWTMHRMTEAVNNFSDELIFVIAVLRKFRDLKPHLFQVGYTAFYCPNLISFN